MNTYRLIAQLTSITWLLAVGGCGQQAPLQTPASVAGTRPPIDHSARLIAQPGNSSTAMAPGGATEGFADIPRAAPSGQTEGTPQSAQTTWDAAAPGSPAAYDLAVQRCDALDGTERTVCMNMADSQRANR
jgi:predicted small lipoprotein YifL